MTSKLREARDTAGLTQRALGARIGASWKCVGRIEMGETPSPALAFALSWALDAPVERIFPELAHLATNPPPEIVFRGKHLTHICDLPRWLIGLELQGFPKPIYYDVNDLDAYDAPAALIERPEQQFILFDSDARTIWVNRNHIQSLRVRKELFTLRPGYTHDFGALSPAHADLRIFFADSPEPTSVRVLDWGVGVLTKTLFSFAHDADYPEFLSFVDNEGDHVCVRSGEISLIELPKQALIEEMRGLASDFWEVYEKPEFEGQPLSDREAKLLLPALAAAAVEALKHYAAANKQAPAGPLPGADVTRFAILDVVEILRQHGFSFMQGKEPSAPWHLASEPRWAPLRHELLEAFDKAVRRARQHGYRGEALTTGQIEAALYAGLAALKGQGYRITPGDLYVAYEPSAAKH